MKKITFMIGFILSIVLISTPSHAVLKSGNATSVLQSGTAGATSGGSGQPAVSVKDKEPSTGVLSTGSSSAQNPAIDVRSVTPTEKVLQSEPDSGARPSPVASVKPRATSQLVTSNQNAVSTGSQNNATQVVESPKKNVQVNLNTEKKHKIESDAPWSSQPWNK